MICIKCGKEDYCSNMCKEHFLKYFYKKFKRYLSESKIISRNDAINLKGKNKEVAKHLLESMQDSINVSFSGSGKELQSYSMEYKVCSMILGLSSTMKKLASSALECYSEDEIMAFCELKKMQFFEEEYTKDMIRVIKELDRMSERKTNIYTSSYKMLTKLYDSERQKL